MRTRLLLIVLITQTTLAYAQAVSSSNVVYLSSLTPVGTPANGFGPYEKDRSNGEGAANDGNPLRIGRVEYAKGLGVHSPSELMFALDKRFVSFSAVVGIDDELLTNGCAPNSPGSVTFRVFVDEVKIYDSGVVTVWSPAKMVSVDVTGKTTLRLVVGDAGDGNVCDHADWADAKVAGPGTVVNAGASDIFSSVSGFSDTQGRNGWSYLDSTGARLTYRLPSSPGLDAVWQGSEEYLIVSRDGGHPGDDKDSVRRWTAPQPGAIRITGNVHDGDPACGSGVKVLIKKGAIPLWQQTIRNGDVTGIDFDLQTTVKQNDTIDFVINKGADGNNRCDTTFFSPTIVLTKS